MSIFARLYLLLDRVTMHRLVMYCLLGVALVAIGLGMTNVLPFHTPEMIASLFICVAICHTLNWVFATLLRAAASFESSIITGLILFFLFAPAQSVGDSLALIAVAAIAIASKYVIALRRRHIINPAAFAAVVAGITGLAQPTWWVGSTALIPIVIVMAILIISKLRRWSEFWVFFCSAAGLGVFYGMQLGLGFGEALGEMVWSWPLIFIGSVMLTDPITEPPRNWQRLCYASAVGLLTASGTHIGGVLMTPELALVIGDLVSYIWSPYRRINLTLVSKTMHGSVVVYAFKAAHRFVFKPGQYLVVGMPLAVNDSRGNRRSFTIASAPSEEHILLGIKHYEPPSAFKRALAALPVGGSLYGLRVAGDFLLPERDNPKILFVAGGIGITPFRSMIQHMLATNQRRDVILVYALSDPAQMVFDDVFVQAEKRGWLRVVYVLNASADAIPKDWSGETSTIDSAFIARIVPDAHARLAYISGPNPMVLATKQVLWKAGVQRHNIKTDYFSGY